MSLEREFFVDGAENVEIGFKLAGLGSRSMAIMIDVVIQTLVSFLLIIPVIFLVMFVSGDIAPFIVIPAVVVLMFVVYWGYHIIFELIWRGQTPGKKIMNIRVVKDDGRPVGFPASFLRNVLRIVDMLPTSYGVGIISAFVNGSEKRLGDLVAGTVVIQVPVPGQPLRFTHLPPEVTHRFDELKLDTGMHRLSLAETALLRQYLQRYMLFEPRSRTKICLETAEYFADKFSVDLEEGLYQPFLLYLGNLIIR